MYNNLLIIIIIQENLIRDSIRVGCQEKRAKEKGKISLRIHKEKINGHWIFFFHKTHHFIHGVRKMNISDDFVLD